MILTSYFYKTRLSKEEYSEVDFKRFRPAASFEAFPVWMDYIRKHFPNEQILFFDSASPISFEQGAMISNINAYGVNSYEVIPIDSYTYDKSKKYYVKALPKVDSNYSFLAVQKQRVEALKFAYLNNLDFFWIDTDCFLNTDVTKYFNDNDVVSNLINHENQTVDGHFIFISKKRLHQWDKYYNLIDYLEFVLNKCPDDRENAMSVREHLLFEGGMYKLFCYGKMKAIDSLNMCHASCYNHFLKWLELNPLNTDNYNKLIYLLRNINREKLKDYLFEFEDTFEIEK